MLKLGPLQLIVEWNEQLGGFYGRAMGDALHYGTEAFATEEEAQRAILERYFNVDRTAEDD